jgi:hypothetical protein
LLERIGLATLFACGVALLAVGVLLRHGRPALSLVELLLSVGIVAGGIWGFVSRPTVFQAALEIDRQTDSAELFSSAFIAYRAVDFPGNIWARAVVASAEKRCQAASMATIKLRRYGGREWGGILLAVALVFTLALLGPAPVHLLDRDMASANKAKSINADSLDSPQVKFIGSSENRPIVLPDPDDLSPNSFGQDQTTAADPSQEKPGDTRQSDAQASAAASTNGEGHGAARTHSPSNPANSQLTPHATESSKPASDKGTATANGAGSSTAVEKSTAESQNGMGAAANSHQATQSPEPWMSSNWPAQIKAAQKAIDGGRVPADYRELVRHYFSSP